MYDNRRTAEGEDPLVQPDKLLLSEVRSKAHGRCVSVVVREKILTPNDGLRIRTEGGVGNGEFYAVATGGGSRAELGAGLGHWEWQETRHDIFYVSEKFGQIILGGRKVP